MHSQTPSLLLARGGCTRPPDPTRRTMILHEPPSPLFPLLEDRIRVDSFRDRCPMPRRPLQWRDEPRGGGSFTCDVSSIFSADTPTDKRSIRALCAQVSRRCRMCAQNCKWRLRIWTKTSMPASCAAAIRFESGSPSSRMPATSRLYDPPPSITSRYRKKRRAMSTSAWSLPHLETDCLKRPEAKRFVAQVDPCEKLPRSLPFGFPVTTRTSTQDPLLIHF